MELMTVSCSRTKTAKRAEVDWTCLDQTRLDRLTQQAARIQADPIYGLPIEQDSGDSLERTLDRLTLGVLVVRSNGEVATLNTAAEALLEENDGLMLQGQTLTASGSFEMGMLRREIAHAIERTRRPTGPIFTIVTISRPSGLTPYVLLIAPLEELSAIGRHIEGAALILVDNLEQPIPHLIQQFRPYLQPRQAESGSGVARL